MTIIQRTTRTSYRSDSVAAGALAGLLSGSCMALLTMVLSASAGMGFWHPIELTSGVIYGVDSILGGVGPAITGIIIQLIVSAGLGALFGALLPEDQSDGGRATGWGLIYGVGCWAIFTFAALPLFNQTMKDRVDLAPGWWFTSFLVFGAVMGTTSAIRMAFGRRVEEVEYTEIRRAA